MVSRPVSLSLGPSVPFVAGNRAPSVLGSCLRYSLRPDPSSLGTAPRVRDERSEGMSGY